MKLFLLPVSSDFTQVPDYLLFALSPEFIKGLQDIRYTMQRAPDALDVTSINIRLDEVAYLNTTLYADLKGGEISLSRARELIEAADDDNLSMTRTELVLTHQGVFTYSVPKYMDSGDAVRSCRIDFGDVFGDAALIDKCE